MASVLRWMGGLDYDGCCETCRGTGSVTVGPWGARPPRDVCPSCEGEGVDPNGPLAGITGTPNGLLVSRRDGWDVLVLPMIVNWRIILGRTGDNYNLVAAFCYQGTGVDTRDRAIAAARAWAEGDVLETDPEGYIKVAADGRAHDYWNRHAGR